MGWARTFLLGDVGNRLDIADTERSITTLRRRLRAASRIDRAQDERLAALERENEELKVCLATLVNALSARGFVSDTDVAAIVAVVEGAADEQPDDDD